MQRPGSWTAILALLAAGWLSAAEPEPAKGSWLERIQPWSKKVPEAQKDSQGKPHTDAMPHTDASRRLRAELTWKRRAEVCHKLRQIAAQTNDAELERFAERLDQRAWEVYLRDSGPAPAVAEPSGGARLGGDSKRESPIHEVRP
jgi:hypothetical protein